MTDDKSDKKSVRSLWDQGFWYRAILSIAGVLITMLGTILGNYIIDITQERNRVQEELRVEREVRVVSDKALFGLQTLFGAMLGKPPEEVSVLEMRATLTKSLVSLNELKGFIETVPAFIWLKKRTVDPETGEVYYVMVQTSNYYTQNLFGRDAEYYNNKRDRQIYDEKTEADFFAADEEAYRKGVVLGLEYSLTSRHTGKTYQFSGVKWHFKNRDGDYIAGFGTVVEVDS